MGAGMKKTIITTGSVEGFFRDLLEEVLNREALQLSEDSSAYLVQLVSGFTSPESLHGGGRAGESGTPTLFGLYESAVTAAPTEQFEAYRRLGDVSLFVSSFFAPQVESSVVSFEYYLRMGGGAYDRAASLDRRGTMRPLMSQLSRKFTRVVEVLTKLAEKTTLPLRRDLATLYERWSRNPESVDLYQRLLDQGAIPIKGRGRGA